MTAQKRKYRNRDYADVRFYYDNRLLDGSINAQRSLVQAPVGGQVVPRLLRLNLVDGDELNTPAGTYVKLSGIGLKTAQESARLGIIDVEFTAAGNTVDATGHGYTTNDQIEFEGSSLPTGVTAGTNYWVINPAADTFQISLTQNGAAVTFSDEGSRPQLAAKV